MGTIQIQNMSFRYDNQVKPIFDHANLQFDASWHLGLIGRNGRGKTTLMNILQDKLEYEGRVITDLHFQYFPQLVADPQALVWDVILSVTKLEEYDQWKILMEFDKLQLDEEILERPFDTLSPGQQNKVLMASLFVDEGNFQLIDEPTNHLDVLGRKVVAEYLQQKSGFIMISHDRAFLNQTIDHVLSIDRAKISLYKGTYDTWYTEKTSQDEFERAQNAKIEGEIDRLKLAASEKARWSGAKEATVHEAKDRGFASHKAAKMMKRSKAIEGRVNRDIADKEKLLKNLDDVDALPFNYVPYPDQKILMTISDLQVAHDGEPVNVPVSFTVKAGERIALTGMNGAGKTSVLRAILGAGAADGMEVSGSVQLQTRLEIGYLAQNQTDLQGTLQDFANNREISFEELATALRKLGFERTVFDNKIEQMSMGQIRKVALAAALVKRANVYIWDEPLNYIDVLTREQLEDIINEYQPTMLFIEHDQMFVDEIATRRIEVNHI